MTNSALNSLSNDAVLIVFGERLAQTRIAAGMTQATLARRAGVSKRTLERIENGASTQTSTLIKLLRVLGLLDAIDAVMPNQSLRPMAMLNTPRPKKRVRVSSRGSGRGDQDKPWSWDDEE